MATLPFFYRYPAKFVRAVDGDTVELVVDTGFGTTRTDHMRLLGVNCHEIHRTASHVAGVAAMNFTDNMLRSWDDGSPWPLYIETAKADSFGRWLANIWPAQDHASLSLSQRIIAAGHGVPFMVSTT